MLELFYQRYDLLIKTLSQEFVKKKYDKVKGILVQIHFNYMIS